MPVLPTPTMLLMVYTSMVLHEQPVRPICCGLAGSGAGALVPAQHRRAAQRLERPLWAAGPERSLPHLHH